LKDSEKESDVFHHHHDDETEQECAQKKASVAYKIAHKTRRSSILAPTGKFGSCPWGKP